MDEHTEYGAVEKLVYRVEFTLIDDSRRLECHET
jgi:hypothetical protein